MFTTGSKLFLGATVLSLVGTLIYAGTSNAAALGTLGMVSATIVLAFLAGINFWVRDGNISAADVAAESTPAAHGAPTRSMWPLIAGLGAAMVPIGLIVGRAITWIAVIVLMIATVEWMVQAWSEGASSDPVYNAGVRKRILHPMELPVLGAVGLGLIIFSFSRIMLRLPKAGGPIVFGGIAAAVLLFGALFATKRNIARSLVATLCAIGAVGIIGAGVASAIAGPRHIDRHEIAEDTTKVDNCTAAHTEADSKSSRAIAAKSNLAATIVLEDGKLHADVIGVNGAQNTVTLPRSTDSYVRFQNKDDGKYRLVANLGYEVQNPGTDTAVNVPDIVCTQAISNGGAQFLVINAPRPSTAPGAPYSFSVPGLDSAGSITIEVP
jgi:hypothetical protein